MIAVSPLSKSDDRRPATAVVDALPLPVWVLVARATPVLANRRARALTGGRHALPSGLGHALRRFQETGHWRVVKLRDHREGRERAFEPSYQVLADGRAVLSLVDVTRDRWLDEADSDFVRLLSHELKTPLSAMGLALQVLAEEGFGPLTDRQGRVMDGVVRDCERLRSVIDDFLSLASPERRAGSSTFTRDGSTIARAPERGTSPDQPTGQADSPTLGRGGDAP